MKDYLFVFFQQAEPGNPSSPTCYKRDLRAGRWRDHWLRRQLHFSRGVKLISKINENKIPFEGMVISTNFERNS
jgi:hypothetical protein